MEKAPREMILEIAKYLRSADRMRFASTCHRIHRILLSPDSGWRNLSLRIPDIPDCFQAMMFPSTASLKKVHIRSPALKDSDLKALSAILKEGEQLLFF
jgi:hypothetical protein